MARRSDAHSWAQYVGLHSRYQRSVHIERDAHTEGWLDGYLLTPLIRSLFGRVVGGLASGAMTRSWSLTGPYGSGKSAFALFLAQVLAADTDSRRARKLLKKNAPELHTDTFGRAGVRLAKTGLVPVLATGERAPLEHILIRALARTAEEFWSGPGAKPKVLREIRAALKLADEAAPIPTRQLVSLFEETASKISLSGLPGAGLLLILDEAGKPLEHIARRGSDGSDVHLLQELAELANRSGDTPIVFMVLLHQAFDQYAADLPTAQRNEWSKVQGRFEDAPFQEGSDQVLRLIGAALEQEDEPPKHWVAHTKKTAKNVAACLREGGAEQRKLCGFLTDTLPLHPLVALALGPLFRSRLAQNERSLFAFLTANEPNGFREFLDEPSIAPHLYELDRLYDYVKGVFGERIYGHQGRAWAQVENGLARLPAKASELDARILKTIGILGAIGDTIPTSKEVIEAAICKTGGPTKGQVDASLSRLRDSSHIVFRRYRNAYQLWDGSDLDLDALVNRALMEAPRAGGLHQRLAKVAPPRPILVRRHSMTTGTLRFFDVSYSDENVSESNLTPSHADGFVWLAIPNSDRDGDLLRKQLKEPEFWARQEEHARPAVIAVPHNASPLRAAARELGALEWVQTNTAELRDDPIARHELDGRIADAEQKIRIELEFLADGSVACDWCYRGQLLDVSARQPLTRHLSDICDSIYYSAAHIHNELLNRNQLSSSAASARRSLMTAMVESADQPRLGMVKFPPEFSMYRSVLEAHRLHRASGEQWDLTPPTRSQKAGSLFPIWKLIQDSLRDSEETRLDLPSLYAKLARPPFGLKSGVIPVIVLSAVLEGMHEIAVYEEGAFVPGITAPVVERMLRVPERFELQRFRLEGARERVFTELAESLTAAGRERPKSIVPIVRSLVRLVSSLPNFSRNTHTVSERAQRVRETLLRAREPGPLLFEKLPIACDCKPFTGKKTSAKQVHEFTHRLRAALRELESAYPKLLERIDDMLREAFDASTEDDSFREELASRAHRLIPAASDSKLKGFLLRAMDDVLDREEWLISVGTLLGKKPPESWYDQDIETAFLSTRLITRRLRTLETLLEADTDNLPDGTALVRVAVAELGSPEREQVVTVRENDPVFRNLEKALFSLVQEHRGELPRDAMVAALARLARELMADTSEVRKPAPKGKGKRRT